MAASLSRLAWVCLAAGGLGACFHGDVTNRYQSLDPADRAPQLAVRANAFALDAPSGGAPRIGDLDDEAQAEYVKGLAAKTTTTDSFRAAIGRPLVGSAGHDRNFGTTDRVVALSFLPKGLRPGDRIDRIDANITLASDAADSSNDTGRNAVTNRNARFVSWDLFQTAYGTVELGKVSTTESATLSAGLTSSSPLTDEIAEANLDGEYSVGRNEEVQLRQRYVELGGALTPHALHLLQEGVMGINLAGTSEIRVKIDFGPTEEDHVYFFSRDAAEPEMSHGAWQVPSNDCPVRAEMTGSARIRAVVSGAETITEGDDRVKHRIVDLTFLDGGDRFTFDIAPGPQVPKRYELFNADGEYLRVLNPGLTLQQDYLYANLALPSWRDATALLDWLERQPDTGDQIVVSGYRLAVARGSDLEPLTGELYGQLLPFTPKVRSRTCDN